MARTHNSRKRIQRQVRLGISLVVISALLLVAIGVTAWLYFSFAAAVSGANAKVGPDIEQALSTPPPVTLAPVPLVSVPPEAAETTEATENKPDVKPDNKPDAAMDLLVLGTDARPGVVESPGASDVLMLLHIDTAQDFMSVMSVHRDLWVDIPGHGEDRINAAYYLGGPAKTIATIKSTFGIDVTEYVGVDFTGFPSIIDRLGGVYVDVDRRYTDTQSGGSDLLPGYQLFDGEKALLYSRYRFDETGNYGRMLRQQRVLAGFRDQTRGWTQKLRLPGIVDALMDSTTTNLDADQMLKLARWLTNLDTERIKQVFVIGPIEQIDGKSVAVLNEAALAGFVTDFFTPPDTSEAAGTPSPEPVLLALAGPATGIGPSATIIDPEKWQAAQAGVSFALKAPTFIPDGYGYAGKVPEGTGTYGIAVGGATEPAVRVLYRYKNTSQYLGISASTWTGAPLAADGTVERVNGTAYTAVGTLGRTDRVWWTEGDLLYWVSNTLTYALSQTELFRIAESMESVSNAPAQ